MAWWFDEYSKYKGFSPACVTGKTTDLRHAGMYHAFQHSSAKQQQPGVCDDCAVPCSCTKRLRGLPQALSELSV